MRYQRLPVELSCSFRAFFMDPSALAAGEAHQFSAHVLPPPCRDWAGVARA